MKEKKREKQQEGKIKWKTWEEEKERHKFNEKHEGEEECREGRGGEMIEREIDRSRERGRERETDTYTQKQREAEGVREICRTTEVYH